MALGSPAVLIVERVSLLFGVWLAFALVAVEAWRGRLPIEISGRGVRYAEAAAGQEMADRARVALGRHDEDIAALRREIAELGAENKR